MKRRNKIVGLVMTAAVALGLTACGVPSEVIDSYQSVYSSTNQARDEFGSALDSAREIFGASEGRITEEDGELRESLKQAITDTEALETVKVPDNVQSGDQKPSTEDFETAQSGLTAILVTDQEAITLLTEATVKVEDAMLSFAQANYDKASEALTQAIDAGKEKLEGTSDDSVQDPETRTALSEAAEAGKKAQTANMVTCNTIDEAQSGAQSGDAQSADAAQSDGPQSDSPQSGEVDEPTVLDCVTEFETATKALNDAAKKINDATAAVQASVDAKKKAEEEEEAAQAAAEAAAAQAAAEAAAQQQYYNDYSSSGYTGSSGSGDSNHSGNGVVSGTNSSGGTWYGVGGAPDNPTVDPDLVYTGFRCPNHPGIDMSHYRASAGWTYESAVADCG